MENKNLNKALGVISNVFSWIVLIGGIILVVYLISDYSDIQLIISVSVSVILGFLLLQILGNLILLILKMDEKIDNLVARNKNTNEISKNLTF